MSLTRKVFRKIRRALRGESPPVQVLDDFFIQHLSYATPGMCVRGNIFLFDKVIRELSSPLPILEIGSWCGQSANIITYLLEKYKKPNQLFTCDGWRYENPDHPDRLGDSKVTFDQYYDFVKSSYIRNTEFFSQGRLPHSIQLLSDDFFAAWDAKKILTDVFGRAVPLGGNFSFCFIDGNHTEEAARRDFENCNRHLESGGQVLFDDSAVNGGWPGVHAVARDVASRSTYDLVMRNPNYLLRKK